MKCPNCGNEMKKGVLRVTNAGSLTDTLTMAIWYSDEEDKKKIMKKGIELRLNAEGFYCDECKEVFARFKEK